LSEGEENTQTDRLVYRVTNLIVQANTHQTIGIPKNTMNSPTTMYRAFRARIIAFF
jgi:hypothetical protein